MTTSELVRYQQEWIRHAVRDSMDNDGRWKVMTVLKMTRRDQQWHNNSILFLVHCPCLACSCSAMSRIVSIDVLFCFVLFRLVHTADLNGGCGGCGGSGRGRGRWLLIRKSGMSVHTASTLWRAAHWRIRLGQTPLGIKHASSTPSPLHSPICDCTRETWTLLIYCRGWRISWNCCYWKKLIIVSLKVSDGGK